MSRSAKVNSNGSIIVSIFANFPPQPAKLSLHFFFWVAQIDILTGNRLVYLNVSSRRTDAVHEARPAKWSTRMQCFSNLHQFIFVYSFMYSFTSAELCNKRGREQEFEFRERDKYCEIA